MAPIRTKSKQNSGLDFTQHNSCDKKKSGRRKESCSNLVQQIESDDKSLKL